MLSFVDGGMRRPNEIGPGARDDVSRVIEAQRLFLAIFAGFFFAAVFFVAALVFLGAVFFCIAFSAALVTDWTAVLAA
jgi:hypothetical protein